MINYKDKPLELLSLEETIEFEKDMRKKVLGAARTNMGESIIDQLNLFVDLISDHKRQCMQVRNMNDEKEDGVMLTLGDIDEAVEQDEDKQ